MDEAIIQHIRRTLCQPPDRERTAERIKAEIGYAHMDAEERRWRLGGRFGERPA